MLVSDYGGVDEFVGMLHLVLRRAAPRAVIVDLTHGIPSHDVRAGALALWRAAPWLGRSVVLGLIDPDGGDAAQVAVEAGRGRTVLIGPDNGLLTPALHRIGPPWRAVALRTAPGAGPSGGWAPGRWAAATFVGRDVLAPAAGRLVVGEPLDSLGPPLDPLGLVGGPLVPVTAGVPSGGGGLVVEAWGVDRFGNVQLGLVPDGLGPGPFAVEVIDPPGSVVDHPLPASADPDRPPLRGRTTAVRASSYRDLPPGALGLVPDADGLVSLSLPRAGAAEALGVGPGQRLRLRRPGGGA